MASAVNLETKKYTIAYAAEAVEYDCPGMRTGPDAQTGTAYLHNEVHIPIYGTNNQVKLANGDTVTVQVETADEAVHYENLCKQITGLTLTKA